MVEADVTCLKGVKSVVTAYADVLTWVPGGAALSQEDLACLDVLACAATMIPRTRIESAEEETRTSC